MHARLLSALALLGAAGLAAPASAVTMDWVLVGAPGNAPDTAAHCYAAGCGSVSYAYNIGKYDVTNAQYVELLNTKAASDPNGLYNTSMGSDAINGGITRSGSHGSYSYAVKPGFESKPVVYVSFWDAARFANWLNNGQGSGDTETGAYTLTPAAISANSVVRNLGAQVFLPSENEWYKAAYYDPIASVYYDYPAGTDAVTTCSGPTGAANSANCDPGGPAAVTPVGAYTGSASPNGTFDQGGNVAQWNEQQIFGSVRGLRGGAWSGDAYYVSAAIFSAGPPTYESGSFGFRVASIPEPSTGLLLLTGLTSLALRRRVRG